MSLDRTLLDCDVEQVIYHDIYDVPLQALRIPRDNGRWYESKYKTRWRVVEDVDLLIVGCDKKVYQLTIPKGMVTNLASRPWYTAFLIPRSQPGHYIAFVAHDYLYEFNTVIRIDNDEPVNVSRYFADQLMRRVLIDKDAPRWRTDAMYEAVRQFGAKTWKRYRARDHAPTPAKS